MCSILLPVDGSDDSDRAVRFLISLYTKLAPVNVHLLHVQAPLVVRSDEAVAPESLAARALTAGEEALQSAKALLDIAGIPYRTVVERGYVASSVVAYANSNDCAGIIMGTRGMGSTEQLLGSIARQVILLTSVPVTLVK